MTILGATTFDEAFHMMLAERRRAGKKREFYDHVKSYPAFPINIPARNLEEFLGSEKPMARVKLMLHVIMQRPGDYHTNHLLSDHQLVRKMSNQVRMELARNTAPIKVAFQSIRRNRHSGKCEIQIQKNHVASMDQEITIDQLKSSLASALLAAADWKTVDKFDLAVISIKLDGRNAADVIDPTEKYFPIALMDNIPDEDKILAMQDQSHLSDLDKVEAFNTLKLQRLLKSLKNDMVLFKSHMIHHEQPFCLPSKVYNLRKLLSSIQWPPAQFGSFQLRIQLFEKEACEVITSFQKDKWDPRSELVWNPEDPAELSQKTLFRFSEEKAKKVREMYEHLKFNIGNDHIQPFLGQKLKLIASSPTILAEKFTKDDLFMALKTERAFMGQIHNQVDAINTPEAYKEVLKLTDFEGLVKRAMIKSTLVLLAMLEDPESKDVDKDGLVIDWCKQFKEKTVMLLVNEFVVSADAELLHGEIFQRSLHIKTAEQWARFADHVKARNFRLRNKRNPDQTFPKLLSLIADLRKKWSHHKDRLDRVERILKYHFKSPKPVEQALEQLAQVCWTLHRIPEKLGYRQPWVIADPEARDRLMKVNKGIDKGQVQTLQKPEVEQHYKISLRKLLDAVEEIEASVLNTAGSTFGGSTTDLIEVPYMSVENVSAHMNAKLFLVVDPEVIQFKDFDHENNVHNLVRTGVAAIFLDPELKARLQVEALFRPNLHNIVQPTLDRVAETTDAEEVLKHLDSSRKQNLLPLEKIKKGMQSEFQCCHTELQQPGTGRGRDRFIQCQNKAAAGHLRCVLHIGSSIVDRKSITSLLLSTEEKRQSKKYPIMNAVLIDFVMQKEEPFQRHPMTMEPIDTAYTKDFLNFETLVKEMEKVHRERLENPNKRFPEEHFRMEFGSCGAHDSWEHVFHWLLFHIAEFAPKQEVPTNWDNYVEFIRYWTKQTGWFMYLDRFQEFTPRREDSWVRPIKPKSEYVGGAAHYNIEAPTNTPEYFNFREPLQINPQPGIIENDQPLYVIDVDHGEKIKPVAVAHIRMASTASNNRFKLINTELDGANRNDQAICPPQFFSLDELVDCSDQRAPFPITTHADHVNGPRPDDPNNPAGKARSSVSNHYVDIMGNELPLQEILDDLTWLTSISTNNCKNNRARFLQFAEPKWRKGALFNTWTNQYIDPNDQVGFDQFVKNEMARLSAPVLLCTMIQKAKKYADRRIQIIWHISGYTDAIKFFKQRLHHCNQISEFMRNHPRYSDVFQGHKTVLDLLQHHSVQLNFAVGVPNTGSITRPNGVEFKGNPDSQEGRAFEAYVKNAPIHCFNFVLVTLRGDPKTPLSEYLMPLTNATATFSDICNIANPSLVTNPDGEKRFGANLRPVKNKATGEDLKTAMGHRRDLIYANTKSVRQFHVKEVLKSQIDSPKHSYKMVNDHRFPKDDRIVPILASRHCRPVVVDDWNYRTTPYAALTVTMVQAFQQMNRQPLPIISEAEARAAKLTTDVFGRAVGVGYANPANMLGVGGTGGFPAPMRMERRDLLIAAAVKSEDHAYAMYNIELYEEDAPEGDIRTSRDVRMIRFRHQKQLAKFNEERLRGILLDISRGIDGMGMYEAKFPLMMIDKDDEFRDLLQEALKDENKIHNGVRFPTMKRAPDGGAQRLSTLSQEAFDDDFCDWDGPRNEFEAQLSQGRQEQIRLEYPEDRAPFQFTLQKRTSEVTLTTLPPVEHMTQLQLAASRSRAEKEEQKLVENRGLEKKRTFTILNETEDFMRAQVRKGRLYLALNEEQKRAFNELLVTPPAENRVRWLVDRLATVVNYSTFLDIMTFCHVEKTRNDFDFVLNYVHKDFVLPELRKVVNEEKWTLIRGFYGRFYEADGLLTAFVSGSIKLALEHAQYYPEPDPRPLPLAPEVYLAEMGAAWARLASFYYRDRPMEQTARQVRNKNRQRAMQERPQAADESEDDTNASPSVVNTAEQRNAPNTREVTLANLRRRRNNRNRNNVPALNGSDME